MRKRLFYSLFLGAALCMTTACSDDDNNGNEGSGGGNGNGNVPVTTVEQAQEEIDRVGKALAAKIDVERLKPTISLLEYCENTFFNEDDEVILPDYPNHPDYGWRSLMRTRRYCRISLQASYRRRVRNQPAPWQMAMERDHGRMGSDFGRFDEQFGHLYVQIRRQGLCG